MRSRRKGPDSVYKPIPSHYAQAREHIVNQISQKRIVRAAGGAASIAEIRADLWAWFNKHLSITERHKLTSIDNPRYLKRLYEMASRELNSGEVGVFLFTVPLQDSHKRPSSEPPTDENVNFEFTARPRMRHYMSGRRLSTLLVLTYKEDAKRWKAGEMQPTQWCFSIDKKHLLDSTNRTAAQDLIEKAALEYSFTRMPLELVVQQRTGEVTSNARVEGEVKGYSLDGFVAHCFLQKLNMAFKLWKRNKSSVLPRSLSGKPGIDLSTMAKFWATLSQDVRSGLIKKAKSKASEGMSSSKSYPKSNQAYILQAFSMTDSCQLQYVRFLPSVADQHFHKLVSTRDGKPEEAEECAKAFFKLSLPEFCHDQLRNTTQCLKEEVLEVFSRKMKDELLQSFEEDTKVTQSNMKKQKRKKLKRLKRKLAQQARNAATETIATVLRNVFLHKITSSDPVINPREDEIKYNMKVEDKISSTGKHQDRLKSKNVNPFSNAEIVTSTSTVVSSPPNSTSSNIWKEKRKTKSGNVKDTQKRPMKNQSSGANTESQRVPISSTSPSKDIKGNHMPNAKTKSKSPASSSRHIVPSTEKQKFPTTTDPLKVTSVPKMRNNQKSLSKPQNKYTHPQPQAPPLSYRDALKHQVQHVATRQDIRGVAFKEIRKNPSQMPPQNIGNKEIPISEEQKSSQSNYKSAPKNGPQNVIQPSVSNKQKTPKGKGLNPNAKPFVIRRKPVVKRDPPKNGFKLSNFSQSHQVPHSALPKWVVDYYVNQSKVWHGSFLMKLSREIKAISESLQKAAQERRRVHALALEALTLAIQNKWPGAKVDAYGSFCTPLFLPSSDVDLVITFPSSSPSSLSPKKDPCDSDSKNPRTPSPVSNVKANINNMKEGSNLRSPVSTPPSVEWCRTRLKVLGDYLHGLEWVKEVKTIRHASLPICKVEANLGKAGTVSLDISIASGLHLGLQTKDLIRVWCQKYPSLVPLGLLLKQLLLTNQLNDPYTGGLSSYGLVVLIRDILRVDVVMKNAVATGNFNLRRGFYKPPSSTAWLAHFSSEKDLGRQLISFLELYAFSFNPLRHIVGQWLTPVFYTAVPKISFASPTSPTNVPGPEVLPKVNASPTNLQRKASSKASSVSPPNLPAPKPRRVQAVHLAQMHKSDKNEFVKGNLFDLSGKIGDAKPSNGEITGSDNGEKKSKTVLFLPSRSPSPGIPRPKSAGGARHVPVMMQHRPTPMIIPDPVCPSGNLGKSCFAVRSVLGSFKRAVSSLKDSSRSILREKRRMRRNENRHQRDAKRRVGDIIGPIFGVKENSTIIRYIYETFLPKHFENTPKTTDGTEANFKEPNLLLPEVNPAINQLRMQIRKVSQEQNRLYTTKADLAELLWRHSSVLHTRRQALHNVHIHNALIAALASRQVISIVLDYLPNCYLEYLTQITEQSRECDDQVREIQSLISQHGAISSSFTSR